MTVGTMGGHRLRGLGGSFSSRPLTMPRHRAQTRVRIPTGTLEGQVVMLTSMSPGEKEAVTQYPLYEAIADAVQKQTRNGVLLPHRDVPQSLDPSQAYAKVHSGIIASNIGLADIGTPSSDVEMMLEIAQGAGLLVVPFYRSGSNLSERPIIRSLANYTSRVEFSSDDQAISRLVDVVRRYR